MSDVAKGTLLKIKGWVFKYWFDNKGVHSRTIKKGKPREVTFKLEEQHLTTEEREVMKGVDVDIERNTNGVMWSKSSSSIGKKRVV